MSHQAVCVLREGATMREAARTQRVSQRPGSRLRRLALAALLIALGQLGCAGTAQAWWNSDWTYRMRVVADASPKGANVTQPIGRTQILVRLHSGNFDFSKARDDGGDLRIVAADDRTPLHFHFEKYDGLVDQVALIWVDLPDIAPGGQTPFYIYWGNKNATNGEDPHATYDPDQVLVWHFAMDAGLPKDSTGYANNALTTVKRDRSGLIGNGALFDGNTVVQLPKSASLAMPQAQAATWSMWVRIADNTPKTAVLFSNVDGANAFTIGLDNGRAYAQLVTASATERTAPGAPVATGWHLIAAETSSGQLTISVDGTPQGTVAATLPAMNGQGVLGGAVEPPAVAQSATAPIPGAPAQGAAAPPAATPNAAAPNAAAQGAAPAPAPSSDFSGGIDEFEVSKVARSEGALQIAVASEGTSAKLLTFDVAEQSSFFGSGYVGIIFRSVGTDSWVVIGLLSIMAALSWYVMIGKALFLSGLNRANNAFRADYQRMLEAHHDENESALTGISEEQGRRHRNSSLFRLYHIGSEELFVRLRGGMVGEGGVLRPQSIAAIRAAIDAGLVRETIRLNRLMVLLTIAIAGGPFLGLLGTVVGVMITFAAIAQAGDVNVNAIAPGISAALLATVFGLFVAIPALFGYNYLLTRIRDAAADMNAFVDQLVTRMGEGLHPAQRSRKSSGEV